jgi:hypothetical protein
MKLQSLSSNNPIILIQAHAKIRVCAYIVAFIHTLGLSANSPDAPQPWAYCATLKCLFSSDSAALCLLCTGRGLLLRLCLFLSVRQADSQKHSADEPAPRSSK